MEDFLTKFNALGKDAQAFVKKYKTKADIGLMKCEPPVECFLDELTSAFRCMQFQLEWLSQSFNDHLKGHLPAAKSVTQMQAAVDVLGLGDEYDVQKTPIYASRGPRGVTIRVG